MWKICERLLFRCSWNGNAIQYRERSDLYLAISWLGQIYKWGRDPLYISIFAEITPSVILLECSSRCPPNWRVRRCLHLKIKISWLFFLMKISVYFIHNFAYCRRNDKEQDFEKNTLFWQYTEVSNVYFIKYFNIRIFHILLNNLNITFEKKKRILMGRICGK